MEVTIQNKMRLDKCDAYTAKDTLGRENLTCQRQEEQQKEKKNTGTEEETNLQKNY